MKWDITADSVAIKKIKEYFKQIYTHKLDKLDEIDHFLKNKLPQFMQYEVDNLNSSIALKTIELIEKSPKRNL